ncbi:MrpF/PhaF family protein [Streptomyces sp. NPDC085524]|uniref:MrpF/PhaF family protein n=1 Tax=unclassified Streptomyces TaxID=2593676 RepID=UPI0036A4A563
MRTYGAVTAQPGLIGASAESAYDRSAYQDLALVLAVLAPAGTLVFTRFVAGRPHDRQAG